MIVTITFTVFLMNINHTLFYFVAVAPTGGMILNEGLTPGGGVLRFGSDGGVPLKPPNPYLSLRVILAEKGTHY